MFCNIKDPKTNFENNARTRVNKPAKNEININDNDNQMTPIKH